MHSVEPNDLPNFPYEVSAFDEYITPGIEFAVASDESDSSWITPGVQPMDFIDTSSTPMGPQEEIHEADQV